jgi:hypothetical protein
MLDPDRIKAWLRFLPSALPIALVGYGLAICIWALPFMPFVLGFDVPWYAMPAVLLLAALAGGFGACVWAGTNEVMRTEWRTTNGGIL